MNLEFNLWNVLVHTEEQFKGKCQIFLLLVGKSAETAVEQLHSLLEPVKGLYKRLGSNLSINEIVFPLLIFLGSVVHIKLIN